MKSVDPNNSLPKINISMYSYDSKSISIDLNQKSLIIVWILKILNNQIKALRSKDNSNVIDTNMITKQMDASQIIKSVLKDFDISSSILSNIIIDEMALYRFFTGTAVSAKTQKHDVFLKPTVPGKKSN